MITAKRVHGRRDLDKRLGRMTLAGFLRSWRLSEGLSQGRFARKLGISPANLCDIEKGRKGVSPKKAARIARTIGYSSRVLVELAINEQLSAAGLRLRAEVKVA